MTPYQLVNTDVSKEFVGSIFMGVLYFPEDVRLPKRPYCAPVP